MVKRKFGASVAPRRSRRRSTRRSSSASATTSASSCGKTRTRLFARAVSHGLYEGVITSARAAPMRLHTAAERRERSDHHRRAHHEAAGGGGPAIAPAGPPRQWSHSSFPSGVDQVTPRERAPMQTVAASRCPAESRPHRPASAPARSRTPPRTIDCAAAPRAAPTCSASPPEVEGCCSRWPLLSPRCRRDLGAALHSDRCAKPARAGGSAE